MNLAWKYLKNTTNYIAFFSFSDIFQKNEKPKEKGYGRPNAINYTVFHRKNKKEGLVMEY